MKYACGNEVQVGDLVKPDRSPGPLDGLLVTALDKDGGPVLSNGFAYHAHEFKLVSRKQVEPVQEKSLGQIAFEAWYQIAFGPVLNVSPSDKWNDKDRQAMSAWQAAAEAVAAKINAPCNVPLVEQLERLKADKEHYARKTVELAGKVVDLEKALKESDELRERFRLEAVNSNNLLYRMRCILNEKGPSQCKS